jgi:hypothetical protein
MEKRYSMSLFTEKTIPEMEERLESSRLRREIGKCYEQIIFMRKGYDEILRELGTENPSMLLIEMTATTHKKKKNTIKRYGVAEYDDGELISYGLSQHDPKQERINQLSVALAAVEKLVRHAKGRLNDEQMKQIDALAEIAYRPKEW